MAEWNPASLDEELDAFLKTNRQEATRESPGWVDPQEGPSWATTQEERQTPSRPSCQYQPTGDNRRIIASGGQSSTLTEPPALVLSTFSASGGLDPKTGPPETEWRRHLTGILHRAFRHFKEQGHLGLEPPSWFFLRCLVPDAWKETALLPTIMATVHALAEVHEFCLTLHGWARIARRNVGPSTGAIMGPATSRLPWAMQPFWDSGEWSVILKIIKRYALQPLPLPEDQFIETLTGSVFRYWVSTFALEVVVGVLEFVWENDNVWAILYPDGALAAGYSAP